MRRPFRTFPTSLPLRAVRAACALGLALALGRALPACQEPGKAVPAADLPDVAQDLADSQAIDVPAAVTADAGADAVPLPAAATWSGTFEIQGGYDLALGQGETNPSRPLPFPHSTGGMLADVSGDGVADVVLFSEGGAWRIDVHGGPSLSGQLPAGVQSVAVTVGADGKPLILLAGQHVTGLRLEAGKVQVLDPGLPDDPDGQRFGLTVTDVDQDGLLDLIVGRNQCAHAERVRVFLARGDGQWLERGESLGLLGNGAQWGILAGDLDLDGDPDVVVLHDGCNNAQTTQVFARNHGRGDDGWPRFVRESPNPLFSFPAPIMPFASPMGGIAADLDGDGRLDLVFANVGFPKDFSLAGARKLLGTDDPAVPRFAQNDLLHALADGTYADVGLAAGLKSLQDPEFGADMVAWSPAAFDFDRDGRMDLAFSHGPDKSAYFDKDRGPMRPVLLQNQGDGTFLEVSQKAGWPAPKPGMTLSAGDVDADGDDDILLGGFEDQPVLLRNHLEHHRHFLRLRLHGTVSNPLGLGAIVRIGSQVRVLGASAPFATMHEPVVDFGLGDHTQADVEILWPSGYVQHLPARVADQTLDVTEPALLQVTSRVLHAGQTAEVTARAFDDLGQPTSAGLQVELVPAGELAWSQPWACTADGWCHGQVQAKAQVPGATTVFLRATLAGQPLAVWPRWTILP